MMIMNFLHIKLFLFAIFELACSLFDLEPASLLDLHSKRYTQRNFEKERTKTTDGQH